MANQLSAKRKPKSVTLLKKKRKDKKDKKRKPLKQGEKKETKKRSLRYGLMAGVSSHLRTLGQNQVILRPLINTFPPARERVSEQANE